MLYYFALLAVSIQSLRAVGNPQSCQSSEYVLAGEFVEFTNSNGASVQCDFTEPLGNGISNTNVPTISNGSLQAFIEPGVYEYNCPSSSNSIVPGTFTVVSSQHRVLVCPDCTNNLIVEVGDVVYWTLVDVDCTLTLVDTDCSGIVIKRFHYAGQGLQEGYQFSNISVYQLVCDGSCTVYATIEVVAGSTDRDALYNGSWCSERQTTKYDEIIYAHATIMAVAFGALLPAGALLANGHYSIAHMIVQPIGLILALTGLVLIVTYKQLNSSSHFANLHEVVGFVILLVSLCVPCLRMCTLIPFHKFWQELFKIWHKRLGMAVVFFGLSNIFLGLHVLESTPVYIMAVYGVWVIVAIFVFVALGSVERFNADPSKEHTHRLSFSRPRRTSDAESANTTVGPSKLTKEILSNNNYVTARKKSVDMLDLKLEELPQKVSPQPARQRKVSNVHFGPVATAHLTPPHTTPIKDTSFGFSDRESSSDETSSDGDNIPEEDEDEEEEEEEESEDDLMIAQSDADLLPTVVIRDSTCSLDSIPSNGGSVRITRHSKRADSKLSEIFERQRSNSNHSNMFTPSPVKEQRSLGDAVPLSKPTPPDSLPLQCPFKHDNTSSTSLPIHMRRTRKNAHVMGDQALNQPPNGDLLILPGRLSPGSRSPSPLSITKKQTSMLVDNTLRSVMKMSENAIISANAQGEIVFWSSGAVKMFGYTPREAIGSSLQMIIPDRLREKHQNGVNQKTEYAMEYIKKHHVAPEEQKHARLYAVPGISKTGQEFTVEVLVSSFVIEGEIFYTGIISELNNQGLTRQVSSASLSSEAEIRERHQKAMAIGAQMKIVHKLKSAEHMSKRELTIILESSLKSAQFEVPENDITLMVEGIVKAADPDETQIIKFIDLIDLLAKHRLYISDSGLIAKYGKSQATQSNLTWKQSAWGRMASFFGTFGPAMFWFVMYFFLNVILLLGGVLSTDRSGVAQWSYGLGPVLSMNCVIILVPSLTWLKHILSGSHLFQRALPINCAVVFHLAIFVAIVFWSVIHVTTHLTVLEVQRQANTTFVENFENSLDTFITGVLVACLICLMLVTSFNCIRKLCRFIGFYVIHYGAAILVYLILLIHGPGCWNPSFWKWLLPFVLIFVAEKLYFRFVLPRYRVSLFKAVRYDDVTRTTALVFERPKHFRFIPGQYIMINIPQIGYFNWQRCIISGPSKEKRLYCNLPNNANPWLQQAFATYKNDPIKEKKNSVEETVAQAAASKIHVIGPFGSGVTLMFDYKVCVLLCGGEGPHYCKPVIQRFLEYARSSTCRCGCHPSLSKLYFIWMTPSGNDFEWFTDYLSDLTEDKHLQKYLDIRIFLTNIDSPPDELASALLHLALKTGGPALSVRRPSQPQLSKLHANTSYGAPDFESLLDFVSMQQGTATDQELECGVFTIGDLPHNVTSDLKKYCKTCSNKRGPTRNALPSSPPRYHDNSLSPERDQSSNEDVPSEWHINFKYHTILV